MLKYKEKQQQQDISFEMAIRIVSDHERSLYLEIFQPHAYTHKCMYCRVVSIFISKNCVSTSHMYIKCVYHESKIKSMYVYTMYKYILCIYVKV